MKLSDISELFEQAIAIEGESAQRAFIETSCHDPRQRDKLLKLVKAHGEICDVVDRPSALSQIAKVIDPSSESLAEGAVVGNYRLLQQIGDGGMGQVFMADQLAPIKRRVAVKIIKAEISSRHILARFEAEREALSRLDHPNITRIFDAGVTDCGLPYFVMELVKGDSLCEYCDRNQLPIAQRVELLEKVCLAVHHAHQKGILHRDIKPSNIMVTMHDGVAVPKVIDFGIAKALDQPLTQQTLFTRYGDMVGTPQYMSPEQAEKSGLDIDSRTDVYSLGVVLYEMLTGTTPIESDILKDKGILGVLETIRDCDTETPSNRITRTLTLDQKAATSRNTTGSLLKRVIRGELDWITMKALSKDRNQRYDSTAAMASDLRCYLRGDSVTAAAPTFLYHVKKIYQRHRAISLALATTALLLLVTSLVSLNWAMSNARLTADIQRKSDRNEVLIDELEKANQKAEQATTQARDAESRALALANEKKQQAAHDRAMSRVLISGLSDNLQDPLKGGRISVVEDGPASKDIAGVVEFAMETTTAELTAEVSSKTKDRSFRIAGSKVEFTPRFVESVEVFKAGSLPVFQKPDSGIRFLELLLVEYRQEFGSEHPLVAECLLDSCQALMLLEPVSWDKVESRTREARSILQNVKGLDDTSESENSFLQIKSDCILVRALVAQERAKEAKDLAQRCEDSISSSLNNDQRNELKKLLGDNSKDHNDSNK